MKTGKITSILLLAIMISGLTLFALSGKVHAAQFIQNGTVAGTIGDDLFVNAEEVTVNATIDGNLFASGMTVTLSGEVYGDAFLAGGRIIVTPDAVVRGNLVLAGGTLDVSGQVGGSLFSGGQLLNLHAGANIAGNIYFGGFSLTTEESTSVSRDVYFGGSQAVMHGVISNNFHAAALGIELYGQIAHDAKLNVAAPGDNKQFLAGLRVFPGATIGGRLVYTSTTDQSAAIQPPLSNPVIYQTPVPSETQNRNTDLNALTVSSTSGFLAWIWTFLRRLITLLVLGALFLWLLPRFANAVKQQMIARPAPSFAYGLLVAVVGFFTILIVPILFILVGLLIHFISLGGLTFTWFGLIGVMLLFVFVSFLWLVFTGGTLAAAYGLGYFIVNKISSHARGKEFLGMLLGITLYILLSSTPWYINWIFALAAGAIGLGASWLAYRKYRRERKMA
jgi:cytoskeletal protein CcmA (bactofilin family)